MAIEKSINIENKRGTFFSNTDIDFNRAGVVSRSLSNWMLTHATVEAWTQFYHQAYQCDIAEARLKAIERYEYETGEKWGSLNAGSCTYAFFPNKGKKRGERNV